MQATPLGHQRDELTGIVEHADLEPEPGTRCEPLTKAVIAGEDIRRHEAPPRCAGTRGGTSSVILSNRPACSTTAGVWTMPNLLVSLPP